jgi:FMN phosphatase YigB (HAD superfamily)
MAMDEKGLGRRLQDARAKAGLTQQTLCQRAGLSYSTLTKIERGAIKAPSIFTIQSIATALGLGLDELMGASAAANPQKHRSRSGVSFVFFDVNGCLVRFFHGAFTSLAEEIGATADAVETTFWHYNDQVCRGEMSMDEFNEAMAKDLCAKNVDWLSHYLKVVEPIEEMRPLVAWAAENYRVGLLTNIMPGFVAVLRQNGLIPDVNYDVILESSSAKSIKPEAEIYQAAAQKAGVLPAEILLVDDTRTNIMAAEKCGWHVLWFDDYRPEESIARIKTALEF